MAAEVHRVCNTETPLLLNWLGKYLPDSWLLYGIVREHIRIGWPHYTFYTLGWPDVQAAAMGPLENNDCGCIEYFNSTRKLAMYSPDKDAATRLLTFPGFVDWTQAIEIRIPPHLTDVITEVVQCKGSPDPDVHSFHVMMAQTGDVKERAIPHDLQIHPLDGSRHASIVNSTWDYKKSHSEEYLGRLMDHFPTLGLFNKDNECLGHVLGTDSATLAVLYVTPEWRGRGLASILISRLAKVYFEAGFPAVTYCHVDNEASINLHEKIGFKKYSMLNFVYHRPNKNV